MKLDISITQKVENEGFHRDVRWLLETTNPNNTDWIQSGCKLAVHINVNAGMFVSKDQLAELNRNSTILIRVDGNVNIETAAHDSTAHIAYIYLPQDEIERIMFSLPIHLRYQRAQITGKYGKVYLDKPTVLVRCPADINLCGKRRPILEAPCSFASVNKCQWRNTTYQALFQDVEMFVPIGDLDDYPLVSIVSLLLGCAGCIYVLSILSTTPI